MTCDSARELYSDYSEGALAPAESQALAQHFAACPECEADYESFRQVQEMLSEGLPAIDIPAGFHASVMKRVSAAAALQALPVANEQTRASLTFPPRPSLGERWRMFAKSLVATPQRAFAAGAACMLVAVAIFSGLHSYRLSPITGHAIPVAPIAAGLMQVPVQHTSGILQNAVSETQGGQTYHYFGIHLPLDSPPANVSAYVLQNGTGLTDDSALNNTDNATPAWRGTVEQGVSIHIPVAVVSTVAPGTTLNFLVVWSPVGDTQTEEKEAAFVPIAPAPATPAPINPGDSLYDVLQNISSSYHAKIFVDATAVSAATQEALVGSSGLAGLTGNEGSARAALQTALSGAGYYITEQSDGSFLIWHA